MYNAIFNIDLDRFVTLLLPIPLRKAKMIQWLFALIAPSKQLYDLFKQYRKNTNYKLEHTPQVYSMQNVLNDTFDNTERRIYIKDGIYKSPVRFYDRSNDSPVHFYDRSDDQPVRFFDRADLLVLDLDFIVMIPAALVLGQSDMIHLKALVDYYRLPDKTYNIQSYE